jgi:hypothetical protein
MELPLAEPVKASSHVIIIVSEKRIVQHHSTYSAKYPHTQISAKLAHISQEAGNY